MNGLILPCFLQLCEELLLPLHHESNPSTRQVDVISRAVSSTAPQLSDMIKELQVEASQLSLRLPSAYDNSPMVPAQFEYQQNFGRAPLSRTQSTPGVIPTTSHTRLLKPAPSPASLNPPSQVGEDARASNVASQQRILLLRGPRVKIGIDHGLSAAELSPVTGRMIYRGKFMNRAARISAKAPSGACWCSESVWEDAKGQSSAEFVSSLGLVSDCLGPVELKGVQEEVNLVHCSFIRASASVFSRMAEAQTLKMSQMVNASYHKPPSLILTSQRDQGQGPSTVRIEMQNLPPLPSIRIKGEMKGPVVRAATRIGLMTPLDKVSNPQAPPDKRHYSSESFGPGNYPPHPSTTTNPGVKYMQAMLDIEKEQGLWPAAGQQCCDSQLMDSQDDSLVQNINTHISDL